MMKIQIYRADHTIEEKFVDQYSISFIEPCNEYLIIYFKDGTYKKVDKITFE